MFCCSRPGWPDAPSGSQEESGGGSAAQGSGEQQNGNEAGSGAEQNPEEGESEGGAGAEGKTGSGEEGAAARVIEHELGETKLEGTPERIVALEFSFVDALASLGTTPVGIADDNDGNRIIAPVRDEIGDYTSVGTRKQPSLEIIDSLNPDLIIADLKRHKEIYDQLSDIAPTIVLDSLQAGYEDNLQSFLVIGEALNRREDAEARLEEHRAAIEAIKAKVPEDESRTVLPAVVTSDLFNAHAAPSYTGELLESLGLKNTIQQEEVYAKLNLEQLLELNPDVMFFMVAGEKTVVDEWKENPLWNEISAVKNGHVYEMDRNLWSRFRGLIAAEMIAEDAVNAIYGE